MRKYLQLIIVMVTLVFLVWLRNSKFEDDVTADIKANPNNSTPTVIANPKYTITPTSMSSAKSTLTPTLKVVSITQTITPTIRPSGMYKDGKYTGSVADAYYGNIQVQAIINGGRLVDVIFLQSPNDNPTSQYINSQAMPLLKEEAISAQSANVSGVSGASASSPAFIVSLTNALAQAKN